MGLIFGVLVLIKILVFLKFITHKCSGEWWEILPFTIVIGSWELMHTKLPFLVWQYMDSAVILMLSLVLSIGLTLINLKLKSLL